jgi:hypothetical protein
MMESKGNKGNGKLSTRSRAVRTVVSAPAAQQEVVPQAEALIAKAIEHNLPVESLERLLDMRERLRAEQAREAYFTGLARFQAGCPVIPKTKCVTAPEPAPSDFDDELPF